MPTPPDTAQAADTAETAESRFTKTVRAALAEHYREYDHRKAVESFDLSGFEGRDAQTVHVTFGAAPWIPLAATDNAVEEFRTTHPNALTEETLQQLRADTIRDFLKERQQENWSLTRQQGDVTILFDENLTAATHPANPSQDGMGDVQELTASLAINGQSFAISGKPDLLKTCLPNLMEWIASAREVERSEGVAFAPCITLDGRANASILPSSRQLSLGVAYVADARFDAAVRNFVLLHESGHAVHAETENILNHSREKVEFAFLPHALFETLEMQGIEETAAGLLDEYGDADIALSEIYALHDTLSATRAAIQPMVEHVRQYPWLDTLDGMAIAADTLNSTSFSTHLQDAPTITLPEDVSDHLNDFLDCIENASSEPEELDADELSQVTDALASLQSSNASLAQDVQLLHDCYQYLSQAKEYLADLHATRNMEHPQEARRFFEINQQAGHSDGRGEACHPKHQQRIEACDSFAQRILREREQAQNAPQKSR